MQPLNKQPNLTGLTPFQAIQTARANQITLPPDLNRQLKEAMREAQNYQLKCKMKPHYQEVLEAERTHIMARVENLADEWAYALQKNVKEMKENNQGKAIQALVQAGDNIQKSEQRRTLVDAPSSLGANQNSVIRVPSHPLLPLI